MSASFRFFIYIALSSCSLHAGIVWETTKQMLTADRTRSEIEVVFPFTNKGEKSVSITDISTSCGCTAAELTRRTYAPGESGKINVTVRYTGDVPWVDSEVQVATDEPATRPRTLSIKVSVPTPSRKERIEVKPQYLSWKRGAAPTPQVATLRITDPTDTIRPVEVKTDDPGFRLQLKSPRVDDPLVYEVVVTPSDLQQPREVEIRVLTNWRPEEWPPGQAFSYRLTAEVRPDAR